MREAIKALGWVPNGSAATLRAGRATLVGLIVPDIRNPFFTEVARGAEDMAAANGEAIVVCNTDWLLADEQRALEALARQRVRGVIINPAGEDERYLEWLSERGIALVLLDHRRSAGTRALGRGRRRARWSPRGRAPRRGSGTGGSRS